MVGVGKLHIQGTIDTKEIDKGFSKVNMGFVNSRKESKSTMTDFTRFDILMKGLGRTFVAVGAGAAGFMVQAARTAPALAGSMANIEVSYMRMLRSFGVGAAPVFEGLSDGLEKVASWTEAHPELFAGTVAGAGILGTLAVLNWSAISAGIASVAASVAASPLLLPVAAGTVLAALSLWGSWKQGLWLLGKYAEMTEPKEQGKLTQSTDGNPLPYQINAQNLIQVQTIADIMDYRQYSMGMREMTMGQNNTYFK